MATLYYDVFTATAPNGPWTKANPTPIEDSTDGNSYAITGLQNGQVYYVMVAAGKYDDDGTFRYVCGQPITAADLSGTESPTNMNVVISKPAVIPVVSIATLGFKFNCTHV